MSWRDTPVNFADLQGKVFSKVEKVADDLLRFTADTGEIYEMYHVQDCCESVYIEDICGELSWLENTPILLADEVSNADEAPIDSWDESYTWTFYHLRTMRGTVTIRWYGCSNGYYSESVDLRLVNS